MKIEKVLNNNAVIVRDQGKEMVVMGRGLAFKKSAGEWVDQSKVEKIFALKDKENQNKLQELLVDIPVDYVVLTEELIAEASEQLNKRFNESIYITLVDHIYTAVFRYKEGIAVKNAMLWDIKRFYPDEFVMGKKALEKIKEYFGVMLSEDEAGFIALHFVNASMGVQSMENTYRVTEMMQEITNIVKYHFGVELNEESVYYYRFVTHLKYLSLRLLNGVIHDDADDELYDVIKNKYKNSHKCVEKISEFIKAKYGYCLSDEEKLYLTIYIERVIYKVNH